MKIQVLQAGAGASLAVACACVLAHDAWLQAAPRQPGSGLLALELGSGPRYPRNEGPVPGSRVINSGCVDEQGNAHALLPRSENGILELRARMPEAQAAACWLELKPVDFTLSPELVKVYFDDIRASPSAREFWAGQQQAGIGWHEVYRKFVRMELPMPQASPISFRALRGPQGFPLELVPLGDVPVRVRVPSDYQALANGKPVAGLPVEFVSRRSPLGIWAQTDGEGRIRMALPFSGEWLLRATALDPPASAGEAWHSRFATLTLQVQ